MFIDTGRILIVIRYVSKILRVEGCNKVNQLIWYLKVLGSFIHIYGAPLSL